MIVTYVRSSSYNAFDYCEMQYFLTYVLGWPSDSGKKADLGTMAHKVMEILAGLKKYQQDNPRKKYLEVNDDKCNLIKIPKDRLYTDDFAHELCDISIDAYSKDSKHNFTNNDKSVVHDTVFTFLTYNDGQFDPRKRNIHHPEPHFDIPIEEEWAKYEYEINGEVVTGQLAIKGTIDLVTLINDETIEVVDWKSGRRMDWATGEVKDYNKLENDAQLMLYFYAISKLYPDYPNRIMSIFFYKNKDGEVDPKPFSIMFDKQDERRFLDKLRKRFEEIKANQNPKLLDPTQSHWKCKYLCHYCKNKWEGSDQNMCSYVKNYIDKHGMDQTVKDCTKPGFNIGFYESPG